MTPTAGTAASPERDKPWERASDQPSEREWGRPLEQASGQEKAQTSVRVSGARLDSVSGPAWEMVSDLAWEQVSGLAWEQEKAPVLVLPSERTSGQQSGRRWDSPTDWQTDSWKALQSGGWWVIA